ncbi:MAG: response regulator [Proteobacteria bacterium]|nr:response regulator [Pseudomonadota bacterium]
MTVTIVVIEDEPATLELIVGYLVRSGHRVQGCATLADGTRAIWNMRPDVIISDVGLPDGNGAIFCMENGRRFPFAKWLLMSGRTDMLRQSRKLIKQADAPPFSVLDKPVSMSALDDFIRLATVKAA